MAPGGPQHGAVSDGKGFPQRGKAPVCVAVPGTVGPGVMRVVVDEIDAGTANVPERVEGLKAELVDPKYHIPGPDWDFLKVRQVCVRSCEIGKNGKADIKEGGHHLLAVIAGDPQPPPSIALESRVKDRPKGIPTTTEGARAFSPGVGGWLGLAEQSMEFRAVFPTARVERFCRAAQDCSFRPMSRTSSSRSVVLTLREVKVRGTVRQRILRSSHKER